MVKVKIINNTQSNFPFENLMREIANKLVVKEKIKLNSECSLIIVADYKIRKLANLYKGKDYITDVLAFSNDWRFLATLTQKNYFGDIYINHNKAKQQAQKYQHSLAREFAYLFAHGFLHLLGYDHLDLISEKEMHQKVNQVLNQLGVTRSC